MMYSMRRSDGVRNSAKIDVMQTILNRPVPAGCSLETSTIVTANGGTIVINVYGPLDAAKRPPDPEIITVPTEMSHD